MTEIDEKSKAFTEAHQGESAEEILAQMRGQDAAESLGLSQEYGKLVDECIYGDEPLDVDAIIEESKQAQADEILSQVIEEPASEDLDKAAMAFSKYFGEWEYAIPCFKAGANWQREQMMKNAVDGNVHGSVDPDSVWVVQDGWLSSKERGLVAGDRVKLLIIKED